MGEENKNSDSEKQFEQIKEELGLNDEIIHYISGVIKEETDNVLEDDMTEGKRKILFLVKELKKRDGRNDSAVEERELTEEERQYIKDSIRLIERYPERFKEIMKIGAYAEERKIELDFEDLLSAAVMAPEEEGGAIFRGFLETAKETGRWAVKALLAARDVYGKDTQKFKKIRQKISDVHRAKKDEGVGGLASAREGYGGDESKFYEFADMAREHSRFFVELMAYLKGIYGNDHNKFNQIKTLLGNLGDNEVMALYFARDVYGDNEEMFRDFVHVAAERKAQNVTDLGRVKDIYLGDKEKYRAFLRVALNGEDFRAIKSLAGAKIVYGDDPELFRYFVDMVMSKNGYLAVDVMVYVRDLYGKDKGKLDLLGKYALKNPTVISYLYRAQWLFDDDIEKMERVAEILMKKPDFVWNFWNSESYMELIREVCGSDIERFEVLMDFPGMPDVSELALLNKIKNSSGHKEIFREYVKLVKKRENNIIEKLSKMNHAYGGNPDVFGFFLNLLKESKTDLAYRLADCRDLYGSDVDKFYEVADVFKEINGLAKGFVVLKGLAVIKALYGDEMEKFKLIKNVLLELLGSKGGSHAVSTLCAAHALYGNSMQKFNQVKNMLVELTQYSWADGAFEVLAEAKDIYGGDMEMFGGFIEMVKVEFSGVRQSRALVAARGVYGNDKAKFEQVKDMIISVVEQLNGHWAVLNALVEASDVYGNDMVKFEQVKDMLVEMAGLTFGSEAVEALAAARDIYGNNLHIFEGFVEAAKVSQVPDIVIRSLIYAKEAYFGNMKMLEGFIDLAMEQDAPKKVSTLAEARAVYGSDMKRFEKIKRMIMDVEQGDYGFYEALSAAKDVYGSDVEKFEQVRKLLMDVSKGRYEVLNAMAEIKNVYGSDITKFERTRDIIAGLVEADADYSKVSSLKDEHYLCGQNMEMFEILAEAIKTGSDELVKKIRDGKGVYEENAEIFREFIEFAKNSGTGAVKLLVGAKKAYGNDVGRFRVATMFFNHREFVETNAIAGYVDVYMDKGEPAAVEYLRDFKKRATGIIGPEPPYQERKSKDYRQLVEYVFPSGNYSSYDNNLSCGDKHEHLEEYQYNHEGYPVEMSGLKGYRLLEGKEEDKELLAEYQNRLSGIRNFVASRGPDNEALQEEFEKKVDALYEQADPHLRKIDKPDVKIKMLVLFLSEVLKKSGQKNYKPDSAILDLIIEYKYAYSENLEAYIQRTADETKRLNDTVSRNFNLWRELSTIYGENLKHVLRHEFFEDMGEKREELEAVFTGLLSVEGESELLNKKARARLEAVFDNEKIPPEKKLAALLTPINGIFLSNLKFKNDADKQKSRDEIAAVMAEMSGKPDKEKFFSDIVPKLIAIRRKYLFDLNAKLEEFFTSDINKINEEIAKYEEVTETEKKETRMGGEKHKEVKKKAKKRKIRGFFLKTQETANARMGAYLCIAGNKGMWENKNYFELVMKDEETGKCVGLAMCLKIQAADGKKYLWFGPNPFEGFLGQVSSDQCYSYLYETVTHFAEENGFDGVVVPAEEGQILGACTNRGGDFPDLIKSSRLLDDKGKLKIVDFGGKHMLGLSYGYEKGALIWDRKSARQAKQQVA